MSILFIYNGMIMETQTNGLPSQTSIIIHNNKTFKISDNSKATPQKAQPNYFLKFAIYNVHCRLHQKLQFTHGPTNLLEDSAVQTVKSDNLAFMADIKHAMSKIIDWCNRPSAHWSLKIHLLTKTKILLDQVF